MTFITFSLLFFVVIALKSQRKTQNNILQFREKPMSFFFSFSIHYIPIKFRHLHGTKESWGETGTLTEWTSNLLRIAVLCFCNLSYPVIPWLGYCSLHCKVSSPTPTLPPFFFNSLQVKTATDLEKVGATSTHRHSVILL